MKKRVSAVISAILAAIALTNVCFAEELKYDVNGDGYENAKDALAILQKSVRGENDLSYDFNGDGYMNAKDALFVLKYAAGIPVETPDPETPDPETPAPETPDAAAPEEFEAEVVRLVNIEREKNGLSALKSDNEKLNRAADIRAEELTTSFSHTRPSGADCFSVLIERGIKYCAAGENIAYGYRTPAEVVEGWLNSPGHRANILTGSFTHIGVGYNENGNYWVQLFITEL